MANWKNDGKLRLMIIAGTRPEIIRLAAVIKKCRQYFDTVLVHTGQNYDYNLNGIFFRDLELKAPEVYLDAVGDNLGQTMGNIIAKSYELMAEMMPDAVPASLFGTSTSSMVEKYRALILYRKRPKTMKFATIRARPAPPVGMMT